MRARLAVLLGVTAVACGGDGSDGPRAPVKVMTRNLYLGGDFSDLFGPGLTAADVPARAGALWTAILATDFPARAKLLADEIAAEAPDLVGLQEVELYRTQMPSDFSFAAPQKNAEAVTLDFLALLLAELQARGAAYTPVAVNALTDVEVPAALATGESIDVRLTDRDVVLARTGVTVVGTPDVRAFDTHLAVPVEGLTVEVLRGREIVRAQVGTAELTFVSSHLEVGGLLAGFRDSQALELGKTIATLPSPLVVVGDFNSAAGPGATDAASLSYRELVRTLRDPWPTLHPTDAGFTCCTPLAAAAFAGTERIDLTLSRGDVKATEAHLVGIDAAKRTATGLFPSDHAGLVTTFDVPAKGP